MGVLLRDLHYSGRVAILFAADFPSESTRLRRVNDGSVQAVARGVWTDSPHLTPEQSVAAHWREIVAQFLPGAVITGRTGFDHVPEGGHLFVSHSRWRPLELPGLIVYPDGRDEHRDDDVELEYGLYGASIVRAIIDNSETRGRPSAPPRRLSAEELRDRLRRILAGMTGDEQALLLAAINSDQNGVAADTAREIIASSYDVPLFDML